MVSHSEAECQSRRPCLMIVVAAGRGVRLGGARPKQYLPLDGKPLLWHTLSRLHAHPLIPRIVPVIAPDGADLWLEWLGPYLADLPKVAAPVAGGAERQDSVRQALESLAWPEDGWVGIHDGARPLVSTKVLDPLFAARDRHEALLSALPVHDTVKWTNADGVVERTLDRQRIWLAHTPQVFRFGLILDAHRRARAEGFYGTDDVSLVERLGVPVGVVAGDEGNFKVTGPGDLARAEQRLKEERDGDPGRSGV